MAAEEDGSLTPFFVVDRPASLQILSGLKLPNNIRVGLMAHANTSDLFRKTLNQFPCTNQDACPLIGGKKCPVNGNLNRCEIGRDYRSRFDVIADSGVFTKEGAMIGDYESLFQKYEDMGVDYGIILDVLKNKNDTIQSARRAMSTKNKGRYSFKLIGVAQGNSVEEYLECYKELQNLGYKHIAVGGMLHKKENSARYVHVRDEALLANVLKAIRRYDPKGWLFALGCYAPGRHDLMRSYNVSGSDYKGWIFQYQTKSPHRGNLEARTNRYAEVRRFVEETILSKGQGWGRPRLLILGCTGRKKDVKGVVPAVELYDGPSFRVLRNNLPEGPQGPLDIRILSAKHGLIPLHRRIGIYDTTMTAERAARLQPRLQAQLRALLEIQDYASITINAGYQYRRAMKDAVQNLGQNLRLMEHDGRIGLKMRDLRRMLQGESWRTTAPSESVVAV